MTTTYVNINSLQEFQDRMDVLGQNAEDYIQKAMYDALNGNVRSAIIKMTPLATTRRYAYNYDSKGNQTRKKGKGQKKVAGNVGTLRKSFRLEIKGTDEIQIGHSAPYAGYVHDTKKPLMGDYWEPGKKGGWTTKGTGPKYVESIISDAADVIPENAVRSLDKRMQQAGIF